MRRRCAAAELRFKWGARPDPLRAGLNDPGLPGPEQKLVPESEWVQSTPEFRCAQLRHRAVPVFQLLSVAVFMLF